MVNIRSRRSNWLWQPEAMLICERRFYWLIMPVTLKVAFGSLQIYSAIQLGVAMFVSCDNIMKDLLRSNA